jgi:uridine kinase
MVIGIYGGSGSGITAIVLRMFMEFRHLKPTIFMDNNYRPIEEQEKDQRGIENFDQPLMKNGCIPTSKN